MSLTRKIGAYLCTAAMVFSLNVKSNALVKEILQVPGIILEGACGGWLFYDGVITYKKKDDNIEENINNNNNNKNSYMVTIPFGLFVLCDAVQRTYFLVFDGGNSKTEKTDNKELNKKMFLESQEHIYLNPKKFAEASYSNLLGTNEHVVKLHSSISKFGISNFLNSI